MFTVSRPMTYGRSIRALPPTAGSPCQHALQARVGPQLAPLEVTRQVFLHGATDLSSLRFFKDWFCGLQKGFAKGFLDDSTAPQGSVTPHLAT